MVAHAGESPQFTILGENEPAPFEGVLFNELAISTVLSDYEIAAYSCDIRTEYELKNSRCVVKKWLVPIT